MTQPHGGRKVIVNQQAAKRVIAAGTGKQQQLKRTGSEKKKLTIQYTANIDFAVISTRVSADIENYSL